jgi:serine protease Do
MERKHRIFIIAISVVIVLLIAIVDLATVSPANANVWTDISDVFNSLKFWQKDDELGSSDTVAETQSGFLRNEIPADSYESRIEYEEAVISAVDKATPSVVSIVVSKDVPILERCPVTDPFFGDGFRFYVPCDSGRTENVEIGGGTGFFVSNDGLILTNGHVVADKEAEYTVFSGNDIRYDARVVGVDDEEDLALLKVEGSGFPVLSLGNSDSVRLGQTAIAIGNALGEYKDTVSVGAISGLSRTITAFDQSGDSEIIEGVLQTDAAINPGNSGGPLINLKGEVIGINTAIADNAENIGFAIPVNKARKVMELLMSVLPKNPARSN